MATELTMPRLSDSMEEGTILKWLVAEGDRVSAGQPLVEVETDKATVVHEALEAGVVLALTVGEGASVPVGAPIAVLGAAGEELPRAGSDAALAAVDALESDAEPEPAGAAVAAATTAGADAAGAATAGATAAGAASAGGTAAGATVTRATTARATASTQRPKASPLARRIAARAGLDLTGLAGSGPQGRVIRADVERAIAGGPEPAGAPAVNGAGGGELSAAKGETTVQELTRIQRTVAQRMAQSRATVPDIELRVQADVGELSELRERLRGQVDPVPSVNDFVVKAAALTLREFPRVNGAYRDGRFELFSRINVGIAVAAPDALLVPTIPDADQKSLAEIGRAARALAVKVREGSIAPAELSGGTFTVSNLGMFGIESFSAVINQPQAAILTVGAVAPRPVVDAGGALVARPTMILTLACDHRILYGADGARFLAALQARLERPLALLLD